MEEHNDDGDLSLGVVFTVSRATPLSDKGREECAASNFVLGTAPSSYPRPYLVHLFTRTRPGRCHHQTRRLSPSLGTPSVRSHMYPLEIIGHVTKTFRWNAAIAFASYLDSHDELINNKFVVELGAGGGLPGIVAAQNGATKVSDRYSPWNHD